MADQLNYSGNINIRDVDDFTAHTDITTASFPVRVSSTNKKMSGQVVANEALAEGDLSALTELTSVDSAADFVLIRDTSAGTNKKIKPSNLASSGSTLAYDSLTSGSFTALCTRLGSSAITISSPATGEFTLTIPSGVDLQRADLFANSATINASLETIVRIDNSANSRARRVQIQVVLANSGSEEVVAWTETVSSNVTTITLPDMNGNGTNGYRILIN